MAVTVITQTITTIINSRGRHLRRGLVDLLQQLDPELNEKLSKDVATTILEHPLVSGSQSSLIGGLVGPRLCNVVHREEFTKLLMALASGQGSSTLDSTAKAALVKALENNGVKNPGQKLKDIRDIALQIERSSPELSNIARQNLAILHAAQSDLVAKINGWFDQTMDRTSQRFTASTRVITFAGAFIVAFGLQVDTPAIVNRLSMDDQLRGQLVADAAKVYDEHVKREQQLQTQSAQQEQQPQQSAGGNTAGTPPVDATPGSPTPSPTPPADPATASTPSSPGGPAPDAETAKAAEEREAVTFTKEQTDLADKHRAMLSAAGLIRLPSSGQPWLDGFNANSILGMLLTALLLSLGAPFWYSMLGQLLQLRSVLAAKDDKQRAERQMDETASAPSRGTAAPAQSAAAAILAGERGDLSAIG
jgi:hypothetical protein